MLKHRNTWHFKKNLVEIVVNLCVNLSLFNQGKKKKKKLLTTIHILALYVWERILVFLGIFFLYLCSVNKSDVQVHFRDFLKNVNAIKILTNFTVLLVRFNAIF